MCPGSAGDALDPGAHGGVAVEVEAALAGHVRVAVERDVGDAQPIADEVVASRRGAAPALQRAVAALVARRQPSA